MTVRIASPGLARAWCARARSAHDLRAHTRAGKATLGFVPTMGALHEGHLDLVRRAAAENDLVCVSVFVNPLQFDDPSDFERYPRDFAADARLLEAAHCHMVFTGTLGEFFPESTDPSSMPREEPGPAAEGLEGSARPGHFQGVATIVRRLFEIVGPTRAYFGEKDFQQTLVVRDLARRLGEPSIVVVRTSREADGLARSSRNARLDRTARERATLLYRALCHGRELWRSGVHEATPLSREIARLLAVPGIELEYAEVRDPERWTAGAPPGPLVRARALVAARIGGVRLIDTVKLDGELDGDRNGAAVRP